MQPLLNKLDTVAHTADGGGPADELPVRIKNKADADTAIRCASYKAKLAAVEKLRAQASAIKRENDTLEQEVTKKRRKGEAAANEAASGKSDLQQALEKADPILSKAQKKISKFIERK